MYNSERVTNHSIHHTAHGGGGNTERKHTYISNKRVTSSQSLITQTSGTHLQRRAFSIFSLESDRVIQFPKERNAATFFVASCLSPKFVRSRFVQAPTQVYQYTSSQVSPTKNFQASSIDDTPGIFVTGFLYPSVSPALTERGSSKRKDCTCTIPQHVKQRSQALSQDNRDAQT